MDNEADKHNIDDDPCGSWDPCSDSDEDAVRENAEGKGIDEYAQSKTGEAVVPGKSAYALAVAEKTRARAARAARAPRAPRAPRVPSASRDVGKTTQTPGPFSGGDVSKRRSRKKKMTAEERAYAPLKEIREQQRSTALILSKRPFERLLLEILHAHKPEFRMQADAKKAFQVASEEHLTELFQIANHLAIHSNRETIMPKDMMVKYQIDKVTNGINADAPLEGYASLLEKGDRSPATGGVSIHAREVVDTCM